MKKLLMLLFTLPLIGCTKRTGVTSEMIVYDYSDVSDKAIEWKQLFDIEKELYFVYIYSLTCPHCKEIKQDVLNGSINDGWDIYYIEYNSEIPIGERKEQYIGVSNYEDMAIIGVPTLLEIKEHTLNEMYIGSTSIISTLYKRR